MLNNVGYVEAYNVAAPKWANLTAGYRYTIILSNQTANDITAGTITIEGAEASPDDPCQPGDTWNPLQVLPECSMPPGTPSQEAQVTFSATNPIKAYGQCQYAVACPTPFVRVSGVPAGVDAIAVVSDLKWAGSPGNPENFGLNPTGFPTGSPAWQGLYAGAFGHAAAEQAQGQQHDATTTHRGRRHHHAE